MIHHEELQSLQLHHN